MMLMAIATVLFAACNKPAGELVGAGATGNFHEANPYGMVYVKRGSFMMGVNGQSLVFSQPDREIKVTVDAFWMDETEVTNDEYKQFTNYVRDSIALQILTDNEYFPRATIKSPVGLEDDERPLDWKNLKKLNYHDQDQWEFLEGENFFQEEINPYNKVSVNPARLRFEYKWINYDQASLYQNKFNNRTGKYAKGAVVRVDSAWVDDEGEIHDSTVIRPLTKRSDFISNRIVCVYPDTLVWQRDFQYAYNEPFVEMYYTHVGYAHYPVVGVSWEQAEAFCYWRTKLFNDNHKIKGQKYRLPTEAEWEWAARGGRKMALYPWGGNYVRSNTGCYMANFKPVRGSYTDDTGSPTMKVASFEPNDFGLFDMAGNVSEWTSSAYNPDANNYIHDMNPSFQYNAKASDATLLKRKVIRGGSWKDIAYYLQCGTRTYEYQYEDRSYIGFRCVRSFIGNN